MSQPRPLSHATRAFVRHVGLALLCLSVVAACSSDPPDVDPQAGSCPDCGYLDPWQAGPYPVGVRSDLWIDESRDALAWTGCKSSTCPRPLPVSIWYPAADGSDDQPAATFDAFFSVSETELQHVVDDLVEELGADPVDIRIPDFPVQSRVDVPIRKGRWPVIIFSHGAGGVRFQNVFQVEYWASHGYIVISPDHEGDATITQIGDELVTVDVSNFIPSGINRLQDVQFMMDRIDSQAASLAGFPGRHAATDLGYGLSGHSFGSFTSIGVATVDPRVAATVPMAAPGISGFGESVPMLLMIASEDDTIGPELNDVMRWQFDIAHSPKLLLELLDAGHFTFSNMCDLFPEFGDGCGTGVRTSNGESFTYLAQQPAFDIINGYGTAWFGAYIKRAPAYIDALNTPPDFNDVRFELY